MNKLLQLIFFALDKMDRKLADHSRRVASLAGYLAEASSDDPKFIKKVYVAGLLHDIGFLKMDVDFNEKPMHQMNEAERLYSAKHGDEGVSLVEGLVNSKVILQGIRHHHELYNGTGKPLGLAGEEIPLVARLLVVADVYDALLVGEMFGQKRNTPIYARAQLLKGSGTVTDPEITTHLLDLLEEGFVFVAPKGLHEDLLYKVRKLQLGPLTGGNLISHSGTVLVREGTEITEHLLKMIKNEYPGQKIIVPATEDEVENGYGYQPDNVPV
jgi:HD superfamily phosphohydrolase YqeK